MSYVFLTDQRVYKLKKPVRFPYLNFREPARREWACREELRLNRRLAPDVYLGVQPLVLSKQGLSIGGDGQVVDWLVVMRRLYEADTLENAIQSGRLAARQVAAVASTLVDFYRHAAPVFTSPDTHLADWRASLNYNRRILLDARFRLPSGLVSRVDSVQRRFLARHAELLRQRTRDRWLRDAHGDLRPEHIWLDDRVRVIDALEFNPRLRANDPFDEVAFLDLECERLGAAWAGRMIRSRLARAFGDGVPDILFTFYRCHRATLRARLAIAHLLEEHPRTPEKWPKQCRAYLALAARDARRLERMLNRRGGR
jgi:aminoglycoside phosphotransferase family enzyme